VIYLLTTIHVLVCVFLILVVLLQQGKGADLSVFGGGNTQTAFGSRGATTLLHKLTVASFVIFILTTILIPQVSGGGSVMKGAGAVAAAKELAKPAPLVPAKPATTVPGKPVPTTPAQPAAPPPH
jgi:preprotein translocase subunit SecG